MRIFCAALCIAFLISCGSKKEAPATQTAPVAKADSVKVDTAKPAPAAAVVAPAKAAEPVKKPAVSKAKDTAKVAEPAKPKISVDIKTPIGEAKIAK